MTPRPAGPAKAPAEPRARGCAAGGEVGARSRGSTPPVWRALATTPLGPGQALGPALQHDADAAFGADLSRVRVHTDPAADAAARAGGAIAFTHGSDIAFRAGEFAPATPRGKRLLAHELAHTVQQTQDVPPSPVQAESVFEREADAAASRAASGEPVGPLSGDARGVPSRQADAGTMAPALPTTDDLDQSQRVMSVLIRPDPIAGMNTDYRAAFALLESLPQESLVVTLRSLDRQSNLELLVAGFDQAPLDERVVAFMIAIREERSPELTATPVERQAAAIAEAVRRVDTLSWRLAELRADAAARPGHYAILEFQMVREALTRGRDQISELRASLLPENRAHEETLSTVLLNMDSLLPDVEAAERSVREFQGPRWPAITTGELYQGAETGAARDVSAGFAQGGWGYASGTGNVLLWLGLEGFHIAANIVSFGYIPRSAANAQLFRRGLISYDAYETNEVSNAIETAIMVVIFIATLGVGAEAEAGVVAVEGEAAGSAVATRTAQAMWTGARLGFGTAVVNDIYSAAVASLTDDPGVRMYHQSMIGGPTSWVASAAGGALFAGVFSLAFPVRPSTGGALAVVEEGAPAASGVGRTFEYQVVHVNPETGEATAIGRSLVTGEVAIARVGVDGNGTMTLLGTGETFPIVGGRLAEPPAGLLPAGEVGPGTVPQGGTPGATAGATAPTVTGPYELQATTAGNAAAQLARARALAPGMSGTVQGATLLQQRAAQLQAARQGWMQTRGTTAAIRVRNAAGEERVLIATESATMPPELAGLLQPGEEFVAGAGHAEETIMNAVGPEWQVIEGGTSRNVCLATCAPILEESGATIGGRQFRGRVDKTPFRMFWWLR